MRSTLSKDVCKERRESLQPALVLEGGKYSGPRRARLILCHLGLVKISLANNRLGKLVLGVVSGPWVEIRVP